MKQIINTDKAPKAIGTYSQAVKYADTVFLSGQIGLDPETMQLVEGGFSAQARQVFTNLQAVAKAAGGSLSRVVKFMVYLTDLENFKELNDIMAEFCCAPYPARAAVEISRLPKDALVEIDAIMAVAEAEESDL